MFQSYDETLQYLYENLPMFQRIGPAALKPDLTNTVKLCEAAGYPQYTFKSVHIAGTNGKGSTSHLLASIMQEAGYTAGLYTSPHLKSFTERIRINGIEISKEFVVDFVNRMRPYISIIQPSFFEITVVMAFAYFASLKVEIAVIETGLGGRLDSTNVIMPELSVITNIGMDHQELLGDTIEKIAREKAGIIKPCTPVVISERQAGIDQVFEEISTALDSQITFASDFFNTASPVAINNMALSIYRHGTMFMDSVNLPLNGLYQRKNILGVLQSVEILSSLGWLLNDASIRSGIERVVSNTGLKGRWQVLREQPLTVCDTAHNVDGLKEVVAQINAQVYANLYIVFGVVKDKDISAILNLLPRDAKYYFCQSKIPRAMEANHLAALAAQRGLDGEVIIEVNDAIRMATDKASQGDMIFIGGSTFVVAEIDNL